MQIKRLNNGSETKEKKFGAWVHSEAEIPFLVLAATSKEAALEAVVAEAPETHQGLPLRRVRFDRYSGDGNIELVVEYESFANGGGTGGGYGGQINVPSKSFDCTTTTAKIIRSPLPEMQRRYPADAPNPVGYIGWNGKLGADAQIDGVDIQIPIMREVWTVPRRWEDITGTFKRDIAGATGKCNIIPFGDWQKGEVLFLGASASGDDVPGAVWNVVYNFGIQLNEFDIRLDDITIPIKYGWEYIWSYCDSVYIGRVPVLKVQGACVDQPYKAVNLGYILNL